MYYAVFQDDTLVIMLEEDFNRAYGIGIAYTAKFAKGDTPEMAKQNFERMDETWAQNQTI